MAWFLPKLTDREREVLGHVAVGEADRDIAGALFISENTVRNHMRNIIEKLEMRRRAQSPEAPDPIEARPVCPGCRSTIESVAAFTTLEVSEASDPTRKVVVLFVYCRTCGHTFDTLVAPED